jgi:hypothetical protein
MDEGCNLGQARVTGHTNSGLWLDVDEIDDDADVFIPFSQIHDDSEVYKKTSEPGDLIVKSWLAEQRGWV